MASLSAGVITVHIAHGEAVYRFETKQFVVEHRQPYESDLSVDVDWDFDSTPQPYDHLWFIREPTVTSTVTVRSDEITTTTYFKTDQMQIESDLIRYACTGA